MKLNEAIEILEQNGYTIVLNEDLKSKIGKAALIGGIAANAAFANSNIPEFSKVDDTFGKNQTVHLHYRHDYPSTKYGVPTDYKLKSGITPLQMDIKDEIELTKQKILATPDSVFRDYGKKHIDVIARLITNAANKYNVDVDGLLAIACVESNFDNHASSGKGAKGMMQITDVAAKDAHTRLSGNTITDYDFSTFEGLEKNIYKAAQIVADLTVRRQNVWEMIFASYNGGTAQATQYRYYRQGKDNTLTKETKNYVEKCMKMYKYYKNIG